MSLLVSVCVSLKHVGVSMCVFEWAIAYACARVCLCVLGEFGIFLRLTVSAYLCVCLCVCLLNIYPCESVSTSVRIHMRGIFYPRYFLRGLFDSKVGNSILHDMAFLLM